MSKFSPETSSAVKYYTIIVFVEYIIHTSHRYSYVIVDNLYENYLSN